MKHRTDKLKKNLQQRLSRIEGQIRGIDRMIQNDIHCKDVVHQINAISAAVAAVRNIVLEDHLKCCSRSGFQCGSEDVFNEIMDIIKKNY